jgi:hypothetical protein
MSGIVPLRRSAIRRLLPSTGSRRVGSPASSVYGRPTSAPLRRTSLPSWRYRSLRSLRSRRRPSRAYDPGVFIFGCPSCGSRGDDSVSQVPGELYCAHSLLFDPGGTSASGLRDASVLPSATTTASAPTSPLSRLNHTACSLAVYASSPRLLAATQDALPTAGQALSGGTGYPSGSHARFQSPLHLILPAQAFLAHSSNGAETHAKDSGQYGWLRERIGGAV